MQGILRQLSHEGGTSAISYWITSFVVLTLTFAAIRLMFCRQRGAPRVAAGEPCCVVVTGAASGLGLAVVQELLRHSDQRQMTVVGLDLRPVEEPAVVEHPNFQGHCVNVVDPAALQTVVKDLRSKNVSCSALVLAAGTTTTGPMVELEPAAVKRVLDVNIFGVFCTVRQFYPLLRRGGVVVPILSEIAYAYNSSAFNGPYAMTKFALEAFTTALRQELRTEGIDVVGAYPGAIETRLSADLTLGAALRHSHRDDTKYAEPLRNFVASASTYIHSNAVEASAIARGITDVCTHRFSGNNLLLNVSPAMRILRYTPSKLFDAVAHWQLNRKNT